MPVKVVDCRCSGCGAGVSPSMSVCEYCGKPVVFETFSSIAGRAAPEISRLLRALESDPDANGALAAPAAFTKAGCYLRLGLHEKAFEQFRAAIDADPGNSEACFYAAVSLLRGRKACLTPMATLERALKYAAAARRLDPRGVYSYFAAYVKNDFFAKKCLRVSPDWTEEFRTALADGLTRNDAASMFQTLGVPCPAALAF